MKKIILLFGLQFFIAHCASVSTLQTARVLDEGDAYHSVGMAFYSSDDFLGGEKISLPLLEYSYRRGVWKDIDVGFKLALIGSASVDAKYRLIDGEQWALSTGIGLGYLSFESSFGDVKQQSTLVDIILPLYLSYDVSKMATVYSAAKLMYRSISGSQGIVSGDGSILASTLGFKWGDRAGVFIEGSLLTGLEESFNGSQFSGAYFFRF